MSSDDPLNHPYFARQAIDAARLDRMRADWQQRFDADLLQNAHNIIWTTEARSLPDRADGIARAMMLRLRDRFSEWEVLTDPRLHAYGGDDLARFAVIAELRAAPPPSRVNVSMELEGTAPLYAQRKFGPRVTDIPEYRQGTDMVSRALFSLPATPFRPSGTALAALRAEQDANWAWITLRLPNLKVTSARRHRVN